MRESPLSLDSSLVDDAMPSESACNVESVSSWTETDTEATSNKHATHGRGYKRKRVLNWLEDNVPNKRLQHILRVETMAAHLAGLHGLDAERAAQAGLMHDLAKCFKPKHLLKLASEHQIPIDPVFEANPHLLHADVGAIVAQTEFNVQDPEILAAIRNHTLGTAGMGGLSCVVFLADTLEPGRGDTPELEKLREISQNDLHQAVWLTSEYTLKHLLDSKSLIHPRALSTRNWAMQMASQLSPPAKLS